MIILSDQIMISKSDIAVELFRCIFEALSTSRAHSSPNGWIAQQVRRQTVFNFGWIVCLKPVCCTKPMFSPITVTDIWFCFDDQHNILSAYIFIIKHPVINQSIFLNDALCLFLKGLENVNCVILPYSHWLLMVKLLFNAICWVSHSLATEWVEGVDESVS